MPTNLNNLSVRLYPCEESEEVVYILTPMPEGAAFLKDQARLHKVNIAVVEGMDWDNDLTPWPAPGQPPGSAPFKGLAPEFLKTIESEIVPRVESHLKISNARRTLCGISLSGLFSLWAWTQTTLFTSLISLSGSFWYENFVEWLEKASFPNAKKGGVYLSLGVEEPKSKVKAFQPVGTDTLKVEKILKKHGAQVLFEWVPGTHFSSYLPRLARAFDYIFQPSAAPDAQS